MIEKIIENLILEFQASPGLTTIHLLFLSVMALLGPLAITSLYFAPKIKRKREVPLLLKKAIIAVSLVAGLVLEVGVLIYYANDYGKPQHYYLLHGPKGQRLAVLLEFDPKTTGSSFRCRVRSYTWPGGKIISDTEIVKGCRIMGGSGAVLWLEKRAKKEQPDLYSRKSAVAVNLYSGGDATSIDSSLANMLPGTGQYQLLGVGPDNHYRIRMQDNSIRRISPGISKADMQIRRANIKLERRSYSGLGLLRAEILATNIETRNGANDGTLVLHYTTAFGPGEKILSLVDSSGKIIWQRKYQDVMGTSKNVQAIIRNNDMLTLIGPSDSYLYKLAVIRLDGRTGKVARKSRL
jgi:hypothetical protein